MTTSAGRGRGYANRNKEFMKAELEGNISDSPPGGKFSTKSMPASNALLPSSSQMTGIGSRIDITNQMKQNMGRMGKDSRPVSGDYYESGQFEDVESFLIDENSQSVLNIDEKYLYFIDQVKMLSEADDGILTNQKLKHLEEVIASVQPNQLKNLMESLASAAILDINMVSKVSKMMSSVSFSFLQIHQQRLYHVFIAALHDKIDGLEISLEGADQYFINVVTLLIEMFKESKMRDSADTSTLAHLIMQVFIGLLECNTPMALRTLNVQLMQYGRNLCNCVPEKLDNLSLSVRKILISRQPPRSSCRIWLLLLADQCLYRFQPLPTYLQTFYARHLDESNCDLEPRDSCFSSELPHVDESVTSKLPQTLTNHRPKDFNREKRNSDASDKWSSISNGEKGYCKNLSDHHTEDDDDPFKHELSFDSLSMSERKPRPILGVGSKNLKGSDSETVINSDIPKFCPSVPPPNYVPKNDSNKSTASQDTCDYWNQPPPSLPPSNLNKNKVQSSLSKRLDLNTWREQSNMNTDYNSYYKELTKQDYNDDKNSFEARNSREYRMDDKTKARDMRSYDDDKFKKYEPRQNDSGTAHWKTEAEKSGRPLNDKKFEWKDNGRPDSDDNKNMDEKKTPRRDNRRSNRPNRRDSTDKGNNYRSGEVSRKASYWTHDDRCDKDYDG